MGLVNELTLDKFGSFLILVFNIILLCIKAGASMRMRIFAHPGATGCGAASHPLGLDQKAGMVCTSVTVCNQEHKAPPAPAIKCHRPQ